MPQEKPKKKKLNLKKFRRSVNSLGKKINSKTHSFRTRLFDPTKGTLKKTYKPKF